jgi:HPt (histidine-containing phosphotransfer) domain-containing protein
VEVLSCVDAKTVAGLRNLRAAENADLYPKLVDLFRTAAAGAMVQLESAIAVDDFQTAGAVCHKLASSAANVGALAFARDLRRLEESCEAGDAARARGLCDRLCAAYPVLVEELMRLQFRQTA